MSAKLIAVENAIAIVRTQGRSVAWIARSVGASRQYTSDALHGHRTVTPAFARSVERLIGRSLFLPVAVSDSTELVTMEATT
jgi:hypothetical protein